MSGTDIYIPELWKQKPANNFDIYALKSALNHFIVKNTNINMNDHVIENVKTGGSNDAVNKPYVNDKFVWYPTTFHS